MPADHDEPQRLYFAYGSNLHPVRLRARLADPRLLGVAVLEDYTLRFNKRGRDGSGKCTIAPAADRVHGAVYALHAADKRRLDAIEGVGAGYDEREVWLAGHGAVYTYVAAPDALDDCLKPFDWYLALVRAGAHFHGFPSPCLERLDRLPAVPDPDAARAASHAQLLASLAAYPPDGCISTPRSAP